MPCDFKIVRFKAVNYEYIGYILGPLGLFVCGIDVFLFLKFMPCSMPF